MTKSKSRSMSASMVPGWLVMISLAGVLCAAARDASAETAVKLQVTGTFARGGDFAGTITINKFEFEPLLNQIVAIGYVQGVLYRGGKPLGTVLAGEKVWPVTVTAGGASLTSGLLPAEATIKPTRWLPYSRAEPRMIPVQEAGCSVLHVSLGPLDVDLLGVQVALSPVGLDLTGGPGPLGELVCAASGLLGRVAELVELLNNVLGLLTGLLGGLTGGLSAATEAPAETIALGLELVPRMTRAAPDSAR